MNILAFDTSTEHCSAALACAGAVATREAHAGQRHSALLLPMVDSLLAEAGLRLGDLDGIAFGAGPGSFTGLRIACGVAQGLALGADLPVAPVGTLLALAHGTGAQRVIACLDARMGEIYYAAYLREGDAWTEVMAPGVGHARLIPAVEGIDWTGCGSGFAVYGDLLAARYGRQLATSLPRAVPHAGSVAQLAVPVFAAAGGMPAEQAVPLYVRDRVALKMSER